MRGRPLCLVCLIFIILCGRYRTEAPADSIFSEETQEMEVTVTGQVYRLEQTSEYQIIYLKQTNIQSKLFVYDRTFHHIKIGNIIQVTGEAMNFAAARNQGNFDARSYYARQGFYGTVYCDDIVIVSENYDSVGQWLYTFRCRWSQYLEEALGEKEGGIMQAILLGEKKQVNAEVKELYQVNGISHILAISGLHITFIGMGIHKLLRKFGFGFFLSGVLALALLGGYVWMTGMAISAMRAFLMLAIRVGAGISGRVYDMPTGWLLSGAILVAMEPAVILDAGFLMSFVAVAGVIFVAPAVRSVFPKITGLVKGLDVGVGVWLALFPILLYFYYEFPGYSILLNLLVVPLVSVILICGIGGSVVGAFSFSAGRIILLVCKWILQLFEWLGRLCEKMPGALIVCGRPAAGYVALFYGCLVTALFVVYLTKEEKKQKKRYLAFLFAGLVLLATMEHRQPDEVQITFLDVGQGDCIFLKGPTGKTYLVDGGSSDVSNVGKYRIIPFLKSQGISRLDYVFVTHGDSDHYSGIAELIESKIAIRQLVFSATYQQEEALMALGRLAKERAIPVTYMKRGEELAEGDFSITCLHPGTYFSGEGGNEASLVLSVSYQDYDILLTGDVEEEGEEELLTVLQEQGKQYEVLKVAHHGSRNSTTEAFLQTICPQTAIISAGQQNSYGHPHVETLERLHNAECTILNTAESGQIQIVIDEDGANLLTFF